MIYQNPSIRKLADTMDHLGNHTVTDIKSVTWKAGDRVQKMKDRLATYSTESKRRPESAYADKSLVALSTGSTGSLGSCLLDTLIRDSNVDKIIYLNRRKDGGDQRTLSHATKSLPNCFDKVKLIRWDYSRPHLVIDLNTYKGLLTEVSHSVHNAWGVNFSLTLDSSADHISGVRQHIDFWSNSTKSARTLLPIYR